MRPMIQVLRNQLSHYQAYSSYFVLALSALAIWFAGPLLTLADTIPLEQPEKRLYAILAVILLWVLKINFWQTKAAAPAPKANPHPDLSKKLQLLEGRLDGAIQFLKKTLLNKHGRETSLDHLPWYLLVGPENAGKTSLLANANINYILSKQFKNNHNEIPKSDSCDWWVTRDFVLVDVPSYFLHPSAKNPDAGRILWQNLLGLIMQHRRKQAINGVILALPLPDLMSSQNKERIVHDLTQRLSELKKQIAKDVPIYLTITKCDLLPGFMDFFGDSSSEEISQAWGITLPRLNENEKLIDAFANRFNALIKRINKQLIWRLHQERNSSARPQIKDFPLQIERLKENLLHVLKSMSPTFKELSLQGIYLTSAIQHAPSEEAEITTHAQNAQALQIMRAPSMPSRPYFIKQLLMQGLAQTSENTSANTNASWRKNPKIFFPLVTLSVILGLILGKEMLHSIKQTWSIRHSLSLYQQEMNQQDVNFSNALPLLNALQDSAASSAQSWLLYSDKAQQSVTAAYNQALQTIVLPEIKNTLEDYLQTHSNTNSQLTYDVLKAYLMLGDQQHIQTPFITETLQRIYAPLNDSALQEPMLTHIKAALNTAWHPINLDPNVIANARKALANLSVAEIAFNTLQVMPSNRRMTTVDLGTTSTQLPALYTAETFTPNYDMQIHRAVVEALASQWVLPAATNTNTSTEIADQLRSLYITQYVAAWEKQINNLHLKSASDLNQMATLFSNVDSSQLLPLLKTIRENTHFAPVLAASTELTALNHLLNADNTPDINLQRAFTAIRQVGTRLQVLASAKELNTEALQMVSEHTKKNTDDAFTQLMNVALLSPEPLKAWLNTLEANAWDLVLQSASPHVDNHWKSDILANYQTRFTAKHE